MIRPPLVVALTLLTLSASCIEPGEPDYAIKNQGIVNGVPAPNDVAVVALTNRLDGFHTCSGTLVTDRIVITASHCLPPYIDAAFGIFEMTDLAIYFGEQVGGSDLRINVAAGKANLAWSEASIPNDIGILYLESPAPFTPIPMNLDLIEDLGLLGTQVRAVGYGTTGPGLSDNGTRLQGIIRLDSADFTNTFSSANPGSVCPGDSGGAMLATIDGIEHLVGVTSRGDCEVSSIHERVDFHYTDFIAPFIANPLEAECGADGECAADCAAPDPDCPCADDGFCDSACDDLGTDPDCSATCDAFDGTCGSECAFADPDCVCVEDGVCQLEICGQMDPDCVLDDGGCGCTSGGPSESAALVLILAALFGLRRRRRTAARVRR